MPQSNLEIRVSFIFPFEHCHAPYMREKLIEKLHITKVYGGWEYLETKKKKNQ